MTRSPRSIRIALVAAPWRLLTLLLVVVAAGCPAPEPGAPDAGTDRDAGNVSFDSGRTAFDGGGEPASVDGGHDAGAPPVGALACSDETEQVGNAFDNVHDLVGVQSSQDTLTAFWVEDGSIGDDVQWASRPSSDATWTEESALDSTVSDIHDVTVLEASSQPRHLLWVEDGSIGDDIQRATADGATWQSSEQMRSSTSDIHDLVAVTLPSGDWLVMWIEDGSIGDDIYASLQTSTGTFEGAALAVSVFDDADELRAVVRSDGAVVAAWIDGDGDDRDVRSSRLTAGTWSEKERLGNGHGGLRLAIDANDNVAAVWVENGGNFSDLRAARNEGTTWSAVERVGSATAGQFATALVVHDDNDMSALWVEDASSGGDVRSSRFSATDGTWTSAQRVGGSFDPLHALTALAVGADTVAVWVETDSSSTLRAASYDAADGTWGPKVRVDSSFDLVDEVVVTRSGNTMSVLWTENGSFSGVNATGCALP